MKKRIFLLLFTFVVFGFGLMAYLPKSITVNLPGGSTTWKVGTTQTITWTAIPSISGTNVKIRLMKGHGGTEDLILKITDSTTNDGSYNWPIPASLTPGSYLIRIKTVDDADGDDGNFFTLAPAPGAASITVKIPKSSSDWQRGTTKTITWTAVGSMNANVKIRLMKGHGGPEDLVLPITESTPTSAGSFPWPIPASLAAGKYLIRVKTVDNDVGDDGDFFDIVIGGGSGTIPDAAKLVIISPKGGSEWKLAQTVPIKWSLIWLHATKNLPMQKMKQLQIAQNKELQLLKTVKIEIRRVNCPYRKSTTTFETEIVSMKLTGGDLNWTILVKKALNKGFYNWLIPSAFKIGCYQVKITILPNLRYMKKPKRLISAQSAVFKIVH